MKKISISLVILVLLGMCQPALAITVDLGTSSSNEGSLAENVTESTSQSTSAKSESTSEQEGNTTQTTTDQTEKPVTTTSTNSSKTGSSKSQQQALAAEEIDSWMPDKQLQKVIAAQLGLSDPAEITQESMMNVTFIKLTTEESQNIASLKGLEFATNITLFYIPKSQISDITPLSQLTKLNTLYLMDSQVSDLTPLENLTALKSLHIDKNPITSYAPIEKLANLEEFGARGSSITDISFLAPLSQLKTVYLWNNQITDVQPLTNKPALNFVELSYNPLGNQPLTTLATLSSITDLYLDGTEISDIQPLSALTALKLLTVYGNYLSDLQPLTSLSNLEKVDAREQRVTLEKEKIAGIQFKQESGIKNLSGTVQPLTPYEDESIAESGTVTGNTILWTNLQAEGTLISQWTNTSDTISDYSFSGYLILPYERVQAENNYVHYVDQEGNTIHEAQVFSGFVGDSYDVTTPEYQLVIKGYTLDKAKMPNNGTGIFTQDTQTITYVYKKNETPIPDSSSFSSSSTTSIPNSAVPDNTATSATSGAAASSGDKGNLPQTGEKERGYEILIGSMLLVGGMFSYFLKKRAPK